MNTTAVNDVFPLGSGADPIRDERPGEYRPFGMRHADHPRGGQPFPADLVYDEELQMITRGGEIWAAKGDPTMTAPPTFKDGGSPNTPADFERDSDKEA